MDFDSQEPFSNGYCFGCGEEKELFLTPNGLRCENCKKATEEKTNTYSPKLRYTGGNDGMEKEMIENLEEFRSSLPEIGLKIEFEDGSSISLNKIETYSVFVKYGDGWKEFVSALRSKVEKYYRNKRKPTRTGDIRWKNKNEFDSQSELAEEVISTDLRASKMQTLLSAMTDKDNTVNVIGLAKDEATVYSEKGRITVPYDKDKNEGDYT